jgi:hypothetical protein
MTNDTPLHALGALVANGKTEDTPALAVVPELTPRMKQARTKHYLSQAPVLTEHMLGLIARGPGASGMGERVQGGGDKHPIPLNANAFDDATLLYSELANWTTDLARHLDTWPPMHVLGLYVNDKNCKGFPSWATPAIAAELVRDLTMWLDAWAPHIAELAIADTYYKYMRKLITPLLGRYSDAPRRPTVAARDCSVCGKHTVIVNFDDDSGLPTIACTYCGHVVPTAGHERYVEELA